MTHFPQRPKQHPANIEKLARMMAAWRFAYDTIPEDVAAFIVRQPECKGFTVVSPNTGHANLCQPGDWIVQTEVGCLYVVKDEAFRRKYRLLTEPLPAYRQFAQAMAARRACELKNGPEP